ncbi:ABC transporter substrate-binding protein [Paenibacillus sp. CMAA1364]
MKNARKKSLGILCIMATLLLSACGGNNTNGNTASPNADGNKNAATESKPVTLRMYVTSGNANLPSSQAILDDYKKETGTTVIMETVAGDGDAIYKKIDVDLSSGGDVDVLPIQNPIIHSKYATNGWLLPLNDLYTKSSYDFEKVYGKNLTKFENDQVYMLPDKASGWMVFYNKKIFDDANVPYPSGEWTWDEYVETAKKLTDSKKGIYGSSMPDYDNTFYLLAAQRGVNGYKEDGSSNFDDVAFKDSLQFLSDLGNVHKVQPSWLEYHSKNIPYDAFMNGSYGMQFIGSWYMFAPLDKENYPRDWKLGVTQTPVDPNGKNNIGITSGLAINKFSKHPEEAADFLKYYAENNYKYNGGIPAREDLAQEDLDKLFGEISSKLVDDGITTQELTDAYLAPTLGLESEKILGSIAAEYGKIIYQEGELFLVGQQPLDKTITKIKERADKAINSAK